MCFLKGIIFLDGPLMVNEHVSWFKNKKRKLVIFKVDFEKAYVLISWEYLDKVMGSWVLETCGDLGLEVC